MPMSPEIKFIGKKRKRKDYGFHKEMMEEDGKGKPFSPKKSNVLTKK